MASGRERFGFPSWEPSWKGAKSCNIKFSILLNMKPKKFEVASKWFICKDKTDEFLLHM